MVNVLNNKKLMYFMLFFLIIQLERAWNSLKWNEKLNLLINVIRGITLPSDMSLDNLKVFLLLKDVLHFFSCQLTMCLHNHNCSIFDMCQNYFFCLGRIQ